MLKLHLKSNNNNNNKNTELNNMTSLMFFIGTHIKLDKHIDKIR